MPDRSTAVRSVLRHGGDGRSEAFDRVVVEEPLEIRVDGEPVAVTMRTPGHDADLAAGFLCTEGVLRAVDEIVAIEQPEPNVVDLRVVPGVDAGAAKRALYSASSCGLCGKATITSIRVKVAPVDDATTFALDDLCSMVAAMRAAQETFEATGGLHAAALFDRAGALEVLREDVGRHNATDKVVGDRLRARGSLRGRALLVSGRAGFEILQKAAVARIPLVAAVSAPSSLAIDLADRLGITLVGFLRPPRASVYTHPFRVL